MDVDRPNLKLFVLLVTLMLGTCVAYQAGYRQGEAAGVADADRRMNRKTYELLDVLAQHADGAGEPRVTAASTH